MEKVSTNKFVERSQRFRAARKKLKIRHSSLSDKCIRVCTMLMPKRGRSSLSHFASLGFWRHRIRLWKHQSSWLVVFSKIRERHKVKGERSRRALVTESGVISDGEAVLKKSVVDMELWIQEVNPAKKIPERSYLLVFTPKVGMEFNSVKAARVL